MTPEPALNPTWRVTTKFFKRGRSVVHVQVKPAKAILELDVIGIRPLKKKQANQTSKYLLSVSRYFIITNPISVADPGGATGTHPPTGPDSFV